MKSDSPLFDRIKVKPDKDRSLHAHAPACEWPGCASPATHRAPKGRLREQEYWRFCLEHVREYNHSYNFFAGMSTDDIAKYQREAVGVLGLEADANSRDIKTRFKALVKRRPPDANGGARSSEDKLREIIQ